MSDGVYYAYLGALVLSALVLAVVAARGSGQPPALRAIFAVVAAGFLGYAVYLAVASPATVTVFYYVLAVPVFAVLRLVRSRRSRPGGPAPAPLGYAAQPGPQQPGFGPPPAPGFGPQPAGFGAQQAGGPGQPGGFAAGQPVSPAAPPAPAPGGFQSAAALFAPPPQPVSQQPPSVDPGTYPVLPSGLAGHHGPDHELPSARPSGLPHDAPDPAPAAPADPSVRPSGLPLRSGPTQPYETAPSQQFRLPIGQPPFAEAPFAHPSATRSAPSHGLPEPAHPRHELQDQRYPQHRYQDPDFARHGDQRAGRPENGYQDAGQAHGDFPQHGYQDASQPQHRYQDQGGQAHGNLEPGYPESGYWAQGQHASYDQQGRHGAHAPAPSYEMPGGHEPTADYEQAGYQAAHGAQHSAGTDYGSPGHRRESGRHEQPTTHPADWPPVRG